MLRGSGKKDYDVEGGLEKGVVCGKSRYERRRCSPPLTLPFIYMVPPLSIAAATKSRGVVAISANARTYLLR
jgi:hypothetical protein